MLATKQYASHPPPSDAAFPFFLPFFVGVLCYLQTKVSAFVSKTIESVPSFARVVFVGVTH